MRERKDRNMTLTLSFGKDSTALGRIRAVIGFIRYHGNIRVMGVSGNKQKVKVILRKGKKYASR